MLLKVFVSTWVCISMVLLEHHDPKVPVTVLGLSLIPIGGWQNNDVVHDMLCLALF